MSKYVIKRIKKIKSFLFFLDFINGTSNSIFPASFLFNFFKITPLLSIIALIPLLADLRKKVPLSMALNIDLAKCCSGPIVFPNQASSEIFTIKFVSELIFWVILVKITS